MWKRILTCILRVWGGMLPPSYCKPFGRIAQKFRAALAACISPNIGKNVNIEKGGYVFPDTVVGDNSGIGVNCEICRGLTLGKNVMMGPECLFYSTNHKFNPETRHFEGYTDIRPIVIEDDVWIGRRAIIMGRYHRQGRGNRRRFGGYQRCAALLCGCGQSCDCSEKTAG